VTLREVLDFVVAEPASAWHVISPPPFRLSLGALSTVWETDSGYRVEVDGHYYLAADAERPEVSLAWGWDLDDDLKFGFTFPERKVTSFAADILLSGSLVHRSVVLSVDGGHYLPFPRVFLAETGEPHAKPEVLGDTVIDWEYKFVRLLDRLTGGIDEYESYFDRSKFLLVQGHPLDGPPPREGGRHPRKW
jgi:hypothetical protein